MSAENVTLKSVIERLWVAPENAEWTPKTDVLPIGDVKRWMDSDDIEILGFMVRVFIKLWDDASVPRELLLELKVWIAELYKNADDRLRTCIVNAALEHLFERKLIRKYFSDWRNDPILSTAYNEACFWDGKTPLSR